jgi:hypothetical protein
VLLAVPRQLRLKIPLLIRCHANEDASFFYWLDQGGGKDLDLPECSRKRLDSMQVRYLSREERLKYLVKVDEQGLLVWAKNGELVWTKDELYRDSVDGIVPIDDSAPTWKHNVPPGEEDSDSSSEESDPDEQIDNAAPDEGEQYVNEEVRQTLLRACGLLTECSFIEPEDLPKSST